MSARVPCPFCDHSAEFVIHPNGAVSCADCGAAVGYLGSADVNLRVTLRAAS